MTEVDLKYLNEERIEAFRRIEQLENALKDTKNELQNIRSLTESKITISEAEAKQILIDISASAQNAKEKTNEIITLSSEVQGVVNSYKKNKTLFNNTLKKVEEIEDSCNTLSIKSSELESKQKEINILQSQLSEFLTDAQQSKKQIKELETESSNSLSKITSLQEKSMEFKGKIEELYDNIMGYDTEEGEHETGLKEELERTYQTLSKSMNDTKSQLDNLKLKYDKTFEEKKKQIEELLPDALTAGLASAYVEKKRAEERNLLNYRKQFKTSITELIGISLIPIIVNGILYFWYDYTIAQIFQTLPTALSFVLPLYLPVLWLAWNSNKEIKLSKRLIEEYTHKEVLSKTYQGLAQQVKELDSADISNELKERLLYNLISVSSENPGKLISDYNKTDNPLIELLDRSIALSNSFEKVKNIPGLGKICSYLKNKANDKSQKIYEKAEEGVAVQQEIKDME